MLNKEFANDCLREELAVQNEDRTLREFLCSYIGAASIDDEDIYDEAINYNDDLIDAWAEDNDMGFDDLLDFLMKNLDCKVKYDISIDMDYDQKPCKMGSDRKSYWEKEVRFEGSVLVNNVSLDMDEWFRSYEVEG